MPLGQPPKIFGCAEVIQGCRRGREERLQSGNLNLCQVLLYSYLRRLDRDANAERLPEDLILGPSFRPVKGPPGTELSEGADGGLGLGSRPAHRHQPQYLLFNFSLFSTLDRLPDLPLYSFPSLINRSGFALARSFCFIPAANSLRWDGLGGSSHPGRRVLMTTTSCPHQWIIETANGPAGKGRCRLWRDKTKFCDSAGTWGDWTARGKKEK